MENKIIMAAIFVAALGIVILLPLNKPAACTQEAKLCPDGSAVGRSGPNCEFDSCPNQAQHYCNPEQRNVICTAIYSPVCGWFDLVKIQCVRYPCAQAFSNGCSACSDDKVLYYTAGECPA